MKIKNINAIHDFVRGDGVWYSLTAIDGVTFRLRYNHASLTTFKVRNPEADSEKRFKEIGTKSVNDFLKENEVERGRIYDFYLSDESDWFTPDKVQV